jgi:hypothetical protein
MATDSVAVAPAWPAEAVAVHDWLGARDGTDERAIEPPLTETDTPAAWRLAS